MIASLHFSQRMAGGKIVAVHSFALDVELDAPLNGIRRARINRNHWLDDEQIWCVGDTVSRLFIYNLSSEARAGKGAGHWFASLLWCEFNKNPWHAQHSEHPTPGRIYDAQVISHAGSVTAVLRLGHYQLEGYLRLSEVPDGRIYTLPALLSLGLHLRVMVIEIDAMRQDISLSIVQFIGFHERRLGPGPHNVGMADPLTPYLRYVDATPLVSDPSKAARLPAQADSSSLPDQTDWHRYGVLLIDDDAQFGKNLVAWLSQLGAQACYAASPTHAREILRQQNATLTHVLLDYDVGDRRTRAELLTLLKPYRSSLAMALISGSPETEAPHYAQRFHLGFIPKPIQFATLHTWLHSGQLPQWQPQLGKPAAYWQKKSPAYIAQFVTATQAWLNAGKRQSGALAWVWLRCYHPEYQMVAESGLPAESGDGWLNHLAQSVVANAALLGQAMSSQNRNDIFSPVWPKQAQQLWALPLHEDASREGTSNVLLIFLPHSEDLPNKQAAMLADMLAWWQTLLALEHCQISLAEDSVFATQGRVHVASLHELRPLLQVFESNTPWDGEVARAWWPQGKKVSNLVNGGLYNIRPERSQQIHLHDRLYSLMHTFLWQMVSQRQITVVVHLPPQDLIVHLPPEVLEQPLINLIDNATKFCGRRRWAQVEVRVVVDHSQPLCPLAIQVGDTGSGMTPEQVRHLFHPLHTASGAKGHGIGLYVSHSLLIAVGGQLILKENWRWGGSVFEMRLPLVWGEK